MRKVIGPLKGQLNILFLDIAGNDGDLYGDIRDLHELAGAAAFDDCDPPMEEFLDGDANADNEWQAVETTNPLGWSADYDSLGLDERKLKVYIGVHLSATISFSPGSLHHISGFGLLH